MLVDRKHVAMISLLLALAFAGLAVCIAPALPADARLPVQWSLDGRPVGFQDKWTALLFPPALILFNSAIFYLLPRFEPHRRGLVRNWQLYLSCWICVIVIHACRGLAELAYALNLPIEGDRVLAGATGLALLTVGERMITCRRMFLIGIITPWTLSNEEVWAATHRLAGRLMMVGGAAMFAAALFAFPPGARRMLTYIVLTAIVVVPAGQSCWAWNGRRSGSARAPKADGILARVSDGDEDERSAIRVYWWTGAILAAISAIILVSASGSVEPHILLQTYQDFARSFTDTAWGETR